MKKGFVIGLVALLGFSNAALAAITSLSTTGTWQTATGDLSHLQGQSAPATWTYDTELSNASFRHDGAPGGMLSGGTFSAGAFLAPTYSLSGTAAPSIFDGSSFGYEVSDNGIVAIDLHPSLGPQAQMIRDGLDPNKVVDILLFGTQEYASPTEFLALAGIMVFDKDFLSGPITTLPTGEELLNNALYTYAYLSLHSAGIGGQLGFATYGYAKSPSAVPVPAAAFMFAPALLGFLGLRRKAKLAHV
ncbi:hypothetical protein A9Q79_05125 [Methylophaga sp. 42_25_T18]|nr:hypothetical protein A9Q79_05125 [Methylophaga sp. 42_25_T18]OUR85824.1 hypothetical protein A9Q92_07290 [Methylophaga sp. 42_8_T64]